MPRARERGADRLVLTTGLKNVDAGRFYRALGFEDHALAMKKSLGDGKSSRLREIRTPRRAVLWRRDEPTGTESFLLSGDEGGWHLEGDIVALLDHEPAHVRYRIVCDPAWRTLAAEVSLERARTSRPESTPPPWPSHRGRRGGGGGGGGPTPPLLNP